MASDRSVSSSATTHSAPTQSPARRALLAAAGGLWAWAGTPSLAQATKRRAVELTFLKAEPGHREHLKTYIVLNWFAMDQVARQQGLMDAFTVMDTGTDDGPWNVLVAVTYRDERGYEGIAAAFERIRQAHRTVPVEGKTLRELGRIVDSKKLYEDTAQSLAR